jgi:hypothetical protein
MLENPLASAHSAPPLTANHHGGTGAMEDFRGKDAQYDRLRDALRTLYDLNVKSGQLERMVKPEADRMGVEAMTRTDIDKFRKGDVERPRDIRRILPLWSVVFSPEFLLPTAETATDSRSTPSSVHDFFHAAVQFYDVHQHRQTRTKLDLLGRFAFYHFSEYFHRFAAVQSAVVVGQWDIHLAEGAYCVEEKQHYDGELGRQKMHDRYTGYCLPKGPNVCLIVREVHRETPKFYMLEALYDHPKTRQTDVLAGYMLKGSYRHKFYHSPVYATRVSEAVEVQCNILRCADIPAHVMEELEALSHR